MKRTSVNQRKAEQLGMPLGTASARLKKLLMFRMAQKLGEDVCYRCGRKIEIVEEFSLEHKEPWFCADTKLFWDLDNVAFSHLACNVGGRRQGIKRLVGENGTEWCSCCKRFLSADNFGKMNEKHYTRPVKYYCNGRRKSNGWERSRR